MVNFTYNLIRYSKTISDLFDTEKTVSASYDLNTLFITDQTSILCEMHSKFVFSYFTAIVCIDTQCQPEKVNPLMPEIK